MPKSLDVAQYIYDSKGWIDAWRLAKLTYYAQAWSLGWRGRPMISEEFQAWTDGPVEPQLHAANRYNRSSLLSTDIPGSDVSRLSDDDMLIIDSIIDYYGDLSKLELIELTHSEQPWLEARKNIPDGEKSRAPLSEATMRRFYSTQAALGESGPVRPDLHTEWDSGREWEFMMRATERWAMALELLADR